MGLAGYYSRLSSDQVSEGPTISPLWRMAAALSAWICSGVGGPEGAGNSARSARRLSSRKAFKIAVRGHDQIATSSGGFDPKGVRYSLRSQNHLTWASAHFLASDREAELTLQDMEQLVLHVVNVQGR